MFHQLTEFFVKEVDYKDEEGVHFAYTLHKMTMEENYSVEEIMQVLLPQESVSDRVAKEETEVIDYTQRMEDIWMEDNQLQERNDLWEPVRRFLERAKKRRMGYEEQDL